MQPSSHKLKIRFRPIAMREISTPTTTTTATATKTKNEDPSHKTQTSQHKETIATKKRPTRAAAKVATDALRAYIHSTEKGSAKKLTLAEPEGTPEIKEPVSLKRKADASDIENTVVKRAIGFTGTSASETRTNDSNPSGQKKQSTQVGDTNSEMHPRKRQSCPRTPTFFGHISTILATPVSRYIQSDPAENDPWWGVASAADREAASRLLNTMLQKDPTTGSILYSSIQSSDQFATLLMKPPKVPVVNKKTDHLQHNNKTLSKESTEQDINEQNDSSKSTSVEFAVEQTKVHCRPHINAADTRRTHVSQESTEVLRKTRSKTSLTRRREQGSDMAISEDNLMSPQPAIACAPLTSSVKVLPTPCSPNSPAQVANKSPQAASHSSSETHVTSVDNAIKTEPLDIPPSYLLAGNGYHIEIIPDTEPDEPLRFENHHSKVPEASAYILTHVAELSKRLLSIELDHAYQRPRLVENKWIQRCGRGYIRRSTDRPRSCKWCEGVIFNGCYICRICSMVLCPDCFHHRNVLTSTLCPKKQGQQYHKQQEHFILSGQFHIKTLESFLQSISTRYDLLPMHIKNIGRDHHALAQKCRTEALDAVKKTHAQNGLRRIRKILEYQTPYHYRRNGPSQPQFQEHWAKGDVLLIHQEHELWQGQVNWSPEAIVEQFGHLPVRAVQCTPQQESREMQLRDYFSQKFSQETFPKEDKEENEKEEEEEEDDFDQSDSSLLWKMEGWPRNGLQTVLPKHYANLLRTLPMPDYTRPDGMFNLARYVPVGHKIPPAISTPKLSHYYGTHRQDSIQEHGSISLSYQATDAVYICVYADTGSQDVKNGPEATAMTWEVFQAQDRHRVEAYLKSRRLRGRRRATESTVRLFTLSDTFLDTDELQSLYEDTSACGVPNTYVSDSDTDASDKDDVAESDKKEEVDSIRYKNPISTCPPSTARQQQQGQKLRDIEGVRPIQVYQMFGQALMIPAGSLYQARCIRDTMLVKVEFISPERVEWAVQWAADTTKELRERKRPRGRPRQRQQHQQCTKVQNVKEHTESPPRESESEVDNDPESLLFHVPNTLMYSSLANV
ncbi:hypothetical protein BGZ94_008398 [Podila epigama]|nr:hypothetical protein BGZ94_008398 [Podila epigama]